MSISPVLLEQLQRLEPDATFVARGRSINSSGGNQYFGKVGTVNEVEQYIGEAESLKAMAIAAPNLSPCILAIGVSDHGRPYFLSEYKELTALTSEMAGILGRRLATELHEHSSSNGFGFGVPTYCGATRLENGWFKTWEECYDSMIKDLLTQLERKGGYSDLCRKGNEVRQMSVRVFGGSRLYLCYLHRS